MILNWDTLNVEYKYFLRNTNDISRTLSRTFPFGKHSSKFPNDLKWDTFNVEYRYIWATHIRHFLKYYQGNIAQEISFWDVSREMSLWAMVSILFTENPIKNKLKWPVMALETTWSDLFDYFDHFRSSLVTFGDSWSLSVSSWSLTPILWSHWDVSWSIPF